MNEVILSPSKLFLQFIDALRVRYFFHTPNVIAEAIVSYLCELPMRDITVAGKQYWSDTVHGRVSATCKDGQTTVDINCGNFKLKSGVEYEDLIVKNIPILSPLVQIHCDYFADSIDVRRKWHQVDTAIMWIDTLDYAKRIGLHKKLPFNILDDTLPSNPMVKFYGCPSERIWDVNRKPHREKLNTLVNTIQWFCSELTKGILACGFELDSIHEYGFKSLHDEPHQQTG